MELEIVETVNEENIEIIGVPKKKGKPKVGLKEDLDDIRRRLKKTVAEVVRIGFSTPVHSLVKEVIERTGLVDEKWIHYTTVEVQNNLYKEFFKKVPREDRVVFIPHCLRDVKNCVADIDEEGYHCKKCGRCIISRIVEECDKRGMKWYICGGGTQVINIVKKIKPKAIIGIACFNEIQLAMDKLRSMKIPIQAVMLKKSGCVNTLVDMDEVMEVLNI